MAGAEPTLESQPSLPDGIMNWKCGNLIGAGAFGRVFLGMNNDNGKLMAVKQVKDGGISCLWSALFSYDWGKHQAGSMGGELAWIAAPALHHMCMSNEERIDINQQG